MMLRDPFDDGTGGLGEVAREQHDDAADAAAELQAALAEASRLDRDRAHYEGEGRRIEDELARIEAEMMASEAIAEAARRRLIRHVIRLDGSPMPTGIGWTDALSPVWRATIGGRRFGLVPGETSGPRTIEEAADQVILVLLDEPAPVAARGGVA